MFVDLGKGFGINVFGILIDDEGDDQYKFLECR